MGAHLGVVVLHRNHLGEVDERQLFVIINLRWVGGKLKKMKEGHSIPARKTSCNAVPFTPARVSQPSLLQHTSRLNLL